ncbi:cytochrome P450 [Phellopilus nigrolimitatus]|nr:cytochrome P450 [Phellopilus nigrolimitatus]
MTIAKVALAAGATIAAYGAWKVVERILRSLFSPLHDLRGPKNASLIFGNLEEIRRADTSALHEQWVEQYGKVMKYKAFFGENRLFTMDTKAMNHILTHSMDYEKPYEARFNLARLLGAGLLVTEGEKHRQQNPSFGPSTIKDLTPIFFQKALQKHATQKIEVLSWLSRTTLDVIGLTGFNYKFDSLNVDKEPSELNKAFSMLFNATTSFTLLRILQTYFPIFRVIVTEREKNQRKAQSTMLRIGEDLLRQGRKHALGEQDEFDEADEKGLSDLKGRDLLSALVRANMDTELPESQRMLDEDVLAQVPTFLVAGHETTSTETMWCLFALAQRPDIQSALRTELLGVESDAPSMDELAALPRLDAVVRETLRLHAAVPSTGRIAMHDDVIPVAEPFVDRKGRTHTEIKIKKGEGIFIPILALNRSKAIWGEDASVFNPDRWANPPEASKDMPGVWGNMMTFLGGAHSCIGYRFALIEMKALLFTLLRTFEFGLAVPVEEIEKRSLVVTRPYLKSNMKAGAQMPLMVKLYSS